MTQPDLFVTPPPEPVGHRLARKAAEKNERVSPGWMALAEALVESFAREMDRPWLAEEARAYAVSKGLPAPHDWRCFGHVTSALRKRGLIRSVGFGAAESSNGSPKTQWIRV